MSFASWFKNKISHQTDHHRFLNIAPDHAQQQDGSPADSETLSADTHYFRLWLSEMYLKNDGRWFQTFYPALHSAVTLTFGNATQTLVHVPGASFLDGIERNLDRVASMNYPLTPLLPFKGGVVTLQAGMLEMATGNSVKTVLNVLGNFSKLLMVPQLSAALSVAGPLADGAAELLGTTGQTLLLGTQQEWAGGGAAINNVLRAGYFAVLDPAAQTLPDDHFWVRGSQLRYGQTLENSQPLSGYNYLLFNLERRDERDDFDSLSSIQAPYEQALRMLEGDNAKKADDFLRAAKVAALTSPDLTGKVDRRRVIDQIQRRYDEARQVLAQNAAKKLNTSLQKAMVGAMSPAESLALGAL